MADKTVKQAPIHEEKEKPEVPPRVVDELLREVATVDFHLPEADHKQIRFWAR